MQGRGESILHELATAAEKWNSSSHLYDELAEKVEQLAAGSNELLQRVLDGSLASGDVSHIAEAVDLLSESERRMVLQATLGSTAIKWLTSMRSGDRVGSASGLKSRVTIIEPGVEVYTGSTGRWKIIAAEGIGKTYSGKLLRIETAPYIGGTMDLGSTWDNHELHGVVDPDTFQPRVELTIFDRKS